MTDLQQQPPVVPLLKIYVNGEDEADMRNLLHNRFAQGVDFDPATCTERRYFSITGPLPGQLDPRVQKLATGFSYSTVVPTNGFVVGSTQRSSGARFFHNGTYLQASSRDYAELAEMVTRQLNGIGQWLEQGAQH